MCPKAGNDWGLSFGISTTVPLVNLIPQSREIIKAYLSTPDIEQRVITGSVMRLHLDEHTFYIFHEPTKRRLACLYDLEIEEFIIKNLKDRVQVIGRVELDEDGAPFRILEVTDIVELDLQPVVISSITSGKDKVEFLLPITATPNFDEESQELIVNIVELNLITSGVTRDDLIKSYMRI